MSITFVSSAERRTWVRLLELDGDRCWERAGRRRQRAARRRAGAVAPGGRPCASA